MTHLPGTPTWVDLITHDPAGSREFYSKVLGWNISDPMPEAGDYMMCFTPAGGVAGFVPAPEDQGNICAWNMYFETANIEADHATALANGAMEIMPVAHVNPGGDSLGHMSMFLDPTGASVGLWQSDVHKGFAVAEVPGTPSWFELSSSDPAKAREFYQALFGTEQAPIAPDFDYTVATVEGQQAYGIMPIWGLPEGTPSIWGVYFSVDDADATCELAVAAGGEVLLAPEDTPYGRLAQLKDAQGGLFKVMSQPKG